MFYEPLLEKIETCFKLKIEYINFKDDENLRVQFILNA